MQGCNTRGGKTSQYESEGRHNYMLTHINIMLTHINGICLHISAKSRNFASEIKTSINH